MKSKHWGMRPVFIAAFALMVSTGVVVAQDRGLDVVARAVTGDPTFDAGRQYAVIIGIDKYEEWPALRNAVSEAKAVRAVLANRYFIDKFYEFYNGDATGANIRRLFMETLPAQIGEKDSLLVFYAGHGQTDSTGTGFWIASDGSKDQFLQNNWIPNQQIRNMIGGLKAQRILILADACFSGDFLNVTRGASPTIDNAYFKKALQLTARQVLTSGASESVPDDSEFGRQLVNLLERNAAPLLDPITMYERLRLGVSRTLPLLGTMPGNEQGASYVLFLKGGTVTSYPGERGSADLMVKTDQPGAEVFVDGISQGKSPVLVRKLEAGRSLHIEARTPTLGGSLDITLSPGDLKEVSLRLAALTGNLYVTSNETAVNLFVDGVDKGRLGSGLLKGIPIGARMIELKGKNLYGSAQVNVNLSETAEARVIVRPVGTVSIDAPEDAPIVLSSSDWRLEQKGGGKFANVPAGTLHMTAGGALDYELSESTISLGQGQSAKWSPWTGAKVYFIIDVPNAILFIDDAPYGVTNWVPPLSFSAGNHKLLFRKPGYHDTTLQINTMLGKRSDVDVKMTQFAAAHVTIPNFGIDLVPIISDEVTEESTGKDYTKWNIPSGTPVRIEFSSPFARRIDIPAIQTTFTEGETRSLDLPSGRIVLPWVPIGAKVILGENQASLELGHRSSAGYRSPPLPPGEYAFSVGSYYSGWVTVPSGGIAEPRGYRSAVLEVSTTARQSLEKELDARRARTAVGWLSLTTGIAGVAGAGTVYWLGGQAMASYRATSTTTAAADAWKSVELYKTLFPITAAVGGVAFGLSPILLLGGPDPQVLQQSIDDLDSGIKALGK